MDAKGQVRWIVDRIVGHEDHIREVAPSDHETRAVETVRKYRIRWIGFPPEQDMCKPRSLILPDVPDVVRAYESIESDYPDQTADMNVLVVHDVENGNCVIHSVENEIDGEKENFVVNLYHHDHENRTST